MKDSYFETSWLQCATGFDQNQHQRQCSDPCTGLRAITLGAGAEGSEGGQKSPLPNLGDHGGAGFAGVYGQIIKGIVKIVDTSLKWLATKEVLKVPLLGPT